MQPIIPFLVLVGALVAGGYAGGAHGPSPAYIDNNACRTRVQRLGFEGRVATTANVHGNPAFAFTDEEFRVLYALAKNHQGTAWNPAVSVARHFEAGTPAPVQLAVVGGRPAIAFFASPRNESAPGPYPLLYVAAADRNGRRWKRPVVVQVDGSGVDCGASDSAGGPCFFQRAPQIPIALSLASVASSPVICFSALLPLRTYPGYAIRRACLEAIDGDDLSNAAYLPGSPFYGGGAGTGIVPTHDFGLSVREVDGEAGVALNTASRQIGRGVLAVLQFQKPSSGFSDLIDIIRGSVTLDRETGLVPFLDLIGKKPAITYLEVNIATGAIDLKFVRANNTAGTAWPRPTYVARDVVYFPPSFADVGGRPLVAFWPDELAFIRAQNTDGTAWREPIRTHLTTFSGGTIAAVGEGAGIAVNVADSAEPVHIAYVSVTCGDGHGHGYA